MVIDDRLDAIFNSTVLGWLHYCAPSSGAQLLGVRAPSWISHFVYGHFYKSKRNTFYTWTKAMYYLILPIIL